MKNSAQLHIKEFSHTMYDDSFRESIKTMVESSWAKIAPFWPLRNLIAVNPLSGFESMQFEKALTQAQVYFQQKTLPERMLQVNRETIKWLQVFFDEGQSTIHMPLRQQGLLKSVTSLLVHDTRVHGNDPNKINWLKQLPNEPEKIIWQCLSQLDIPSDRCETFLTLMLTTLPGWAGYIQYLVNWADAQDAKRAHLVSAEQYLALRLVFTSLMWPKAKLLLDAHDHSFATTDTSQSFQSIVSQEKQYQKKLLHALSNGNKVVESAEPKAQMVFCIDVRSEPFRRAIESQGQYETLGFAGFFGVPITVKNAVTGESHASCPVLLKPMHTVVEHPSCSLDDRVSNHQNLISIKKLYQSLKYTFTTPFSLVETMGIGSGLWMGLKSFTPHVSMAISEFFKKKVAPEYDVHVDIGEISFLHQVNYAASALKLMGLTDNFSPLIVLCGHGSTTLNNAYASSLDCGACGGRHGASNARVLAKILNTPAVRQSLKEQGLNIPEQTLFLAAEHNTTTDKVKLFDQEVEPSFKDGVEQLKVDLDKARTSNNMWRLATLDVGSDEPHAQKLAQLRSLDWAQVRPEWGLARNAAFIVGPRSLTAPLDLEGRSFLHSYHWEKDPNGKSLTTILTAPMVVAQWINAQYLFSTLDNVAFGGGSKNTKNITGKIGIMQGNASDLMTGLALQSVFKTDTEPYHAPLRLTVVVNAPRATIEPIVKQHESLHKLIRGQWIHLFCLDPEVRETFRLEQDLSWSKFC